MKRFGQFVVLALLAILILGGVAVYFNREELLVLANKTFLILLFFGAIKGLFFGSSLVNFVSNNKTKLLNAIGKEDNESKGFIILYGVLSVIIILYGLFLWFGVCLILLSNLNFFSAGLMIYMIFITGTAKWVEKHILKKNDTGIHEDVEVQNELGEWVGSGGSNLSETDKKIYDIIEGICEKRSGILFYYNAVCNCLHIYLVVMIYLTVYA